MCTVYIVLTNMLFFCQHCRPQWFESCHFLSFKDITPFKIVKWAADEFQKKGQLPVGQMVKILPFPCYIGKYVTWQFNRIGSQQLHQTPLAKAKLVMDIVPHYYSHLPTKYQWNTEWKFHHKNFNVDFLHSAFPNSVKNVKMYKHLAVVTNLQNSIGYKQPRSGVMSTYTAENSPN